ncbi:hypothetical protein G7046_g1561 [Stylonectria norvegica]|nr:hypothetical protein G7046_g1561 [Stylonectria norvegica]
MSSELEGLIGDLLVRISCAGEKGCSVEDVLDAIQHPPRTSEGLVDDLDLDPALRGDDSDSHHRTASTIWQWLSARRDVSIGLDRSYNHLTLDQILQISPVLPSTTTKIEQVLPVDPALEPPLDPQTQIRVYASEDTMWESLTGHAIDYKRVPRSEWLLLLGIASTTSRGILQGDLGRLVDQDKRSVPKRTDALLSKGYISKRTTLVRGTKTSKMWLKTFAPSLPKDSDNTDQSGPEMQLTRQVLLVNLDPVPWHSRWTGESVDYTALATSIMAISKEWGVLRMQDLKAKLGVLGLRWQMKVLAKVCRFLNARGVIQYVAAKLGGKVFKDCIKYGREMNSEDWSTYLATGKRTKKPSRHTELADAGAGDSIDDFNDLVDPLLEQPSSVTEVSSAPPWSLDQPLPATIAEMAQRLGDTGLTNPDVYALTLGPSFSRYLSSLTASLSTQNIQPPHLQHLQLRSEHTRTGKVASYRYFANKPGYIAGNSSDVAVATLPGQQKKEAVSTSSYGFAPIPATALAKKASTSLADLCYKGPKVRKPRGRPKRSLPAKATDVNLENMSPLQEPVQDEVVIEVQNGVQPEDGNEVQSEVQDQIQEKAQGNFDEEIRFQVQSVVRGDVEEEVQRNEEEAMQRNEEEDRPNQELDDEVEDGVDENDQEATSTTALRKAKKQPAEHKERSSLRASSKVATYVVTLKVSPEALDALLRNDVDQPVGGRPSRARRTRLSLQVPDTEATDEFAEPDIAADANLSAKEESAPQKRGRGPGKKGKRGRPSDSAAGPKPWKCDKCGGSWKNDIGLKYHLEKSRTACNPSYDETAKPPVRLGKKRALSVERETVNQLTPASTPKEDGSTELPSRAGSNSDQEQRSGDLDHITTPLPKRRRGASRKSRKPHILADVPPSRPSITLTGSPFAVAPEWRRPPLNTSDAPNKVFASRGALVQSKDSQPRPVLALSSAPKPKRATGQVESPLNHPEHSRSTLEVPPTELLSVHSTNRADTLHFYSLPENNTATQECLDPQLESEYERLPQPDLFISGKSELEQAYDNEYMVDQHPKKNARGKKPFGNGSSKSVSCQRICGIINDLLTRNDGVFPGGRALCHVIGIVWGESFPAEPIPTSKACHAALREMLKKNNTAEHWHAFRDGKGMFSKCQVIIRPTLDPFAPEAMALVDKIKETFPQIYVPPPFTAPAGTLTAKEGRRGRRNLAEEIEVLDAPVYVAQAAAKRAAEEEDDVVIPSLKRLKRKARARGPGWSPFGTRKSGRVRWIAAKGDRGSGDPAFESFRSLSYHMPPEEIQFLAPNMYLDDDPPESFHYPGMRASLGGSFGNEHSWFLEAVPPSTVFEEPILITGSNGTWPYLNTPDFEEHNASYALNGWVPDTNWFAWSAIVEEIEEREAEISGGRRQKRTEDGRYERFVERLIACVELEQFWAESFIDAPTEIAGPFNIFVDFSSKAFNPASDLSSISWPADGQFTVASMAAEDEDPESFYSDEDDKFFAWDMYQESSGGYKRPRRLMGKLAGGLGQQIKPKRVRLATRILTSLPEGEERSGNSQDQTVENNIIDDPERLLAAFIAIRVLLGGADKAVDWGLLAQLYPDIGLTALRRFWLAARKEQGAYIAKLTKDFQDRFLAAYAKDELPEIDFEDPLDYDWQGLVDWTMQLPIQEGILLPPTRSLLNDRFSSQDADRADEDWQEKFYHVQASVFSRFEWATAAPAAVAVDDIPSRLSKGPVVTDLDVAKSWIKSLCCTGEARYSVEQVKDKLSSLVEGDPARNNLLLKQASEDLTRQRIICRSKKPALGGRPYRLNEWYPFMIAKLGQQSKYQEAAAFKSRLDAAFHRGKPLHVPYTLDDGSAMALTNLNGAGRIRLVPVDVPHIPMGFEPGNYESRKYPKSYYHFGMDVLPTETYQYDEDIEVLKISALEGPPCESVKGELPQWIDFFGERDAQRWMEILGAFCFLFATRGFMSIDGICTALKPILEEFEAQMIINWGKRTGVLKDSPAGLGTTVGEWWWLAVPWQAKGKGKQRATEDVLVIEEGPEIDEGELHAGTGDEA